MNSLPKVSKRRSKGREYAQVKINGKAYHLGRWETPEAQTKFARLIAEHSTGELSPHVGENYTVAEAIADYLEHAADWRKPKRI